MPNPDNVAGKPQQRLEVTYLPLAEITPYERNSRTHTDDQIGAIAASIAEFGWTNPILIADGRILAGHARLAAAELLASTEAPTIDLSHLTPEQRSAYVIADNRLAENGSGRDLEMLEAEFEALDAAGYELDMTGFDQGDRNKVLAELDRARNEKAREGEDDVRDKPGVETAIKVGDVIELGRHRLICGDATDPDVVAELLRDVVPSLMVTDPPYGVSLDANWRAEAGLSTPERSVIDNDDRSDWREAYALFEGDVAYVWHAGIYSGVVHDGLEASGFECRAQIIWRKNRFVLSRGHYHWQHEPCWYAVRKGGSWTGDRKQSTFWNVDFAKREPDDPEYGGGAQAFDQRTGTVWEVDMMTSLEFGHPNQKPVECMRRPILNNSSPGQAVYDPFGGTGSTLIAAELTGRQAFLIELRPDYCEIIRRRYERLIEEAGDVSTENAQA